MIPCKKTVIGLFVVTAFCFVAGPSAAQQSQQRDIKIKKVVAPKSHKGSELFGESYALIFGVSDYNNGLKRLPGVKDDVVAVSEVLRQHGFNVKVVMNPTQPEFDQAMRDFISQHGLAEKNRLLIYFAGHGYTIESSNGAQGYLVPVNAPHPDKNEAGFINAAISFDMIQVYARMIRSKYALFVFDSCFSGSLFQVRGEESLPPPIASIAGLPIRQFIASGSAKQTVPDKSIFRRQFVEALSGAADIPPQDGYITGTELGMYLHRTVTTYTANDNGKPMQTPQYGKIRDPDYDRGEFIFISPLPATNKVQKQVYPSREESQPPRVEVNTDANSTSEPARSSFRPIEEMKSVTVLAKAGWVSTGLMLKPGQLVEVKASGSFRDGTRKIEAAGLLRFEPKSPLPSCQFGALLARVGNGAPVCIRDEGTVDVTQTGELQLGVNAHNLQDNAGAFNTTITVRGVLQHN